MVMATAYVQATATVTSMMRDEVKCTSSGSRRMHFSIDFRCPCARLLY